MNSAGLLTMKKAECAYLQLAAPGRPVENAGVLLLDPEAGRLYMRLRRDWAEIAPEETDVLEMLAADLDIKAASLGAAAFFEYLQTDASNLLRVTDREEVLVSDFNARLNRLYREHVQPKVLEFRTHLPLYSARAAAGKFSGEMEVEPEGWVEAPEDLKLSADMFAAHVTGRSMEPEIPDGSLCVFRANPQGSRIGRRLLIENLTAADTMRYTIKRYQSTKESTREGGWRHTRIRLEPLNPEFEAWDLRPGDFRVVGELLRVLPAEE